MPDFTTSANVDALMQAADYAAIRTLLGLVGQLTGGGTIATGGFTLTVDATGTVVLSGSAASLASIALGGAPLGGNALAVNGNVFFSAASELRWGGTSDYLIGGPDYMHLHSLGGHVEVYAGSYFKVRTGAADPALQIDSVAAFTVPISTTGTSTLTGGAFMGAPIRLKTYTVATLPAGTQGDSAAVTDALAPTFLSTIVGGGSAYAVVSYNGADWAAI